MRQEHEGKSETGLTTFIPNPVPSDHGHVPDISPWNANLGDTLFLNKLLLWNQPHLTGRHQFPGQKSGNWQWPTAATADPEG